LSLCFKFKIELLVLERRSTEAGITSTGKKTFTKVTLVSHDQVHISTTTTL